MDYWRKRKATNVEKGAVVSLWIVSTIVRYLRNISFERMYFELTDWRFIHHIEMRTDLIYRDSDYLGNNHNWGTYFGDAIDTQGIGGAIVIRYSRNFRRQRREQLLRLNNFAGGSAIVIWYSKNRRRDRYSILNNLYSRRKRWRRHRLSDSQGWLDGWRRDHYLILNKLATGANALTSSLRHTQSKRPPDVFPLTNSQQIQNTIAVGSTLAEALVCSETQSIFNTQPNVGGAIDIQYCLTEDECLDDGQINL